MEVDTYLGFEKIPVYILGPSFEEKKCPTLLYFSLSGEESLALAPYNQLATFLVNAPCRTISVTLPGHHEGQDKHQAMAYWAAHLQELQSFVKDMHGLLDHLFDKQWINSDQFAVAGLSRGGWIATHMLSHPRVLYALGLAPVTDLTYLSEFKSCAGSPLLKELALENLFDKLYSKSIRYYIGNRDEKVSTQKAFEFVQRLADYAYDQRVRSSKIELTMTPSTGHLGHGTLSHTFEEAALWVKKKIVL